MGKRGYILSVIVLIMLASIGFAQDFDVSINVPESVDVNEEIDIIINLDVINDISNGVMVGVVVPEGLEIIKGSAVPDDGLIVDNAIMWVLEPVDISVSFKAKSEVPGEYNIDVKVGTYYKISGTYEEIGSDRSMTILGAGDVWIIIDLNNNKIIETSELLNAINRWIAGEIDTTIILEGINMWIGK